MNDDKVREVIESAVFAALEAGWTAEQAKEEFLYALETAQEEM